MQQWVRWVLVALITLGTVGLGCAAIGREKWGPFRGEVVDMETGKPIAGAVALVVWWEVVPTPVHGTSRFYDAQEAVTGPDGRFEVPRLSVPVGRLGVQPGQVTIFAPGYQWEATLVTPPGGEEFVDPTVIRMRRLKTREELSMKSRSRPSGVPLERIVEFTKAVNLERRTLGLDPLPIPPVERRQP